MDKQELIKVVARYINNNWNASLGYGDDEKVITRTCDDLDWLLNAAGITTKDIIDHVKNNNSLYVYEIHQRIHLGDKK